MSQKSPLKDEIRSHGLTPKVKDLLKEKYAELEKKYVGLEKEERDEIFNYKFIKSMVGYQVDSSTRVKGYRKKLSVGQIEQIERILSKEIFEEEYPNGSKSAAEEILSILNFK